MKVDYLIVGAGFTGATLAERLAAAAATSRSRPAERSGAAVSTTFASR